MSGMKLTRDGALLWMNDRLGNAAHMSVMVGEESAFPASSASLVAYAGGTLEHWREAVPPELWSETEREANSGGLYKIGTGGVNLGTVAGAIVSDVEDAEGVEILYVPLDANVGVYIAVADSPDAIYGSDA